MGYHGVSYGIDYIELTSINIYPMGICIPICKDSPYGMNDHNPWEFLSSHVRVLRSAPLLVDNPHVSTPLYTQPDDLP